jgi:membrane peptidoglycan carboxypeptidase
VDAARCPVGDHSATSRCKTATAGNVRDIVKAPVAGKSGTTDSEKTSALVAMTKQYAVAGIEADPDWPQTTQKMGHDVPTGINPAVYETLRDAMLHKERIEFTPPSGKILEGDQGSIPSVTCKTIDEAKSRLREAGFQAVVSSSKVPSDCPAGTAAGTSPDGRTIQGGVVTIEVSDGGSSKPGGDPTTGTLPPPPNHPGRR